jgi:multisubunit Na+/H+ antiporter MnhB subunit
MRATRSYIGRVQRVLLAVGLLPLLATLLRAVLSVPARPPDLTTLVAARLKESGVAHPLTAVLLNFRGYDTLLELAVLWLAGLGALALAPGASASQGRPHPALAGLLRVLAPALVMTAGYILWAGSFRPGGAFQSGATLGAGLVLASLSGYMRISPTLGLRIGLAAGVLVFVAAAGWAWARTGELLHYPGDSDKWAILAIESTAALSIACILLTLFNRLTANGASRAQFLEPGAAHREPAK